jgi:hypothetical protein
MATENSVYGCELKFHLIFSKVLLKYMPFAHSGVAAVTGPGRPILYGPEHASRDPAGRFGVARSTIGGEELEAAAICFGMADANAHIPFWPQSC